MPGKSSHKPGNIAPHSGQYKIVGPRGGSTKEGERTVVRGEPFPPTPKRGQRYKMADATKHKSKK